MKKVLMMALIAGFINQSTYAQQETWPSDEQSQRHDIATVIAKINQQSFYQTLAIKEQFSSCGGSSALSLMLGQAESNRKDVITQCLKRLGTPVSYQVYQEMLAAGYL